MIRSVGRSLLPRRALRSIHASAGLAQKKDKLYFGQFTQAEYDEAAAIVKGQMENLEKQIKGENDPRLKLGTMPSIPAAPSASSPSPASYNSLSDILIQSIKTTGPLSLSAYMRQCLTHPEFGYYTTRDPLDSKTGDFITSPEISSVFGEMIGIWLFSTWMAQGKPRRLQIVEFGPGKGTLMHDVVQTFNKLSRSSRGTEIGIVMIEASPVLRTEQWKLLCGGSAATAGKEFNLTSSTTKWGNSIRWVDTEKDIEASDDVANYILAHEFFDALPIKSFEKKEGNSWRELLVEHTSSVNNTQPKLEGSGAASGDAAAVDASLLETDFHLTISPKDTPASFIPKNSARFKDLPVDSRIEICPDAGLYITKMAELVKDRGACLVMDYGISSGIPDNTLRGIYKHKFVSPFYRPGEVDLSIDVDFENLKQISSPLVNVYGPTNQGDWLHEVGIGYRIDQLIKATDNVDEQEKIYNAYLRLTGTDDKSMGKVYKFLSLLPKTTPEPPVGFLGAAAGTAPR